MSGGIIIRTIPEIMQAYGCSVETAMRYIDMRNEGYSMEQAKLMAGLSDPPDDEICSSCNGTGDAYIPRDGRMAARCDACKGRGVVYDQP